MLAQIYEDMIESDFIFYDADFPLHVFSVCRDFSHTYGSRILSIMLEAMHSEIAPVGDEYGDFLKDVVVADASQYLSDALEDT